MKVGYECYGMQSDLEYFEERMKHEGYRFEIDEVAWANTGGHSKQDRVERLVPDLMSGKFLLSPVA